MSEKGYWPIEHQLEAGTIVLADFVPPPFSMSFHDQNGGVISELKDIDGELVFAGNADESATIFFNEIIKHYQNNSKK